MSNMITDLVSNGFGVFIDSGDDGLDEQNQPYVYHIAVTRGEWGDLTIVTGQYSHDLEETLRELLEEVRSEG